MGKKGAPIDHPTHLWVDPSIAVEAMISAAVIIDVLNRGGWDDQ